MNKAQGTVAIVSVAAITLGLLLAMNASALARGDEGFEEESSTHLVELPTETQPLPPTRPLPLFGSTQTFSTRSYVQGIRIYSITILDDKEIAVGLKFRGDDGTPGVAVIVFTGMFPLPLRGVYPPPTDLPRRITPASEQPNEKPEIYPIRGFRLIGSNFAPPGWKTPATVTVSLAGEGSLSEANHVEVVVVPYIPS